MLKFAIIGPSTANTQDLCQEVLNRGHQATVLNLSEITFKTSGSVFEAYYNGLNMSDFDVVIFRGYNIRINEAQLLAQMLVEKKVTIIEQSLAGNYVRGKMQQAKRLVNGGINHPKTFQANNFDGWQEILTQVPFPIIAKPTMGRKGRGIQKLSSMQEALEFFKSNSSDYLAQQYFPIVSDYRILVVGGRVIGGFQRFINEGQFKSNIKGTRAEKIVVSKEMEKIALLSTDVMGYEISGVDIFEYENKLYIIEVNVAPQWEKFKLITGMDPAKHIVEYAIEKHSNRKK